MKKLIALAASMIFFATAHAGNMDLTYNMNTANYDSFSPRNALLVEKVGGSIVATLRGGSQKYYTDNNGAWTKMMADPVFLKTFAQINSNKWVNGQLAVNSKCQSASYTIVTYGDGGTENIYDSCAIATALALGGK